MQDLWQQCINNSKSWNLIPRLPHDRYSIPMLFLSPINLSFFRKIPLGGQCNNKVFQHEISTDLARQVHVYLSCSLGSFSWALTATKTKRPCRKLGWARLEDNRFRSRDPLLERLSHSSCALCPDWAPIRCKVCESHQEKMKQKVKRHLRASSCGSCDQSMSFSGQSKSLDHSKEFLWLQFFLHQFDEAITSESAFSLESTEKLWVSTGLENFWKELCFTDADFNESTTVFNRHCVLLSTARHEILKMVDAIDKV